MRNLHMLEYTLINVQTSKVTEIDFKKIRFVLHDRTQPVKLKYLSFMKLNNAQKNSRTDTGFCTIFVGTKSNTAP